MPTVSIMNIHPFFIFVKDNNPSANLVINERIFFQNAILRMKKTKRHAIAAADIRIIIQLFTDADTPSPGVTIPTSLMNWQNTFHCKATAIMVMRITMSVSIRRSEMSVPSDCAKGILSYCSNTTQRETSPTRGTTRFAAYAINTE